MTERSDGQLRHMARQRALSDLAAKHQSEFHKLFRLQYAALTDEREAGEHKAPKGRRPAHRANSKGMCAECGKSYPCPVALRRKEYQE